MPKSSKFCSNKKMKLTFIGTTHFQIRNSHVIGNAWYSLGFMVNSHLTLRAEAKEKGGYCNPRLTCIICYDSSL